MTGQECPPPAACVASAAGDVLTHSKHNPIEEDTTCKESKAVWYLDNALDVLFKGFEENTSLSEVRFFLIKTGFDQTARKANMLTRQADQRLVCLLSFWGQNTEQENWTAAMTSSQTQSQDDLIALSREQMNKQQQQMEALLAMVQQRKPAISNTKFDEFDP